MREIRLPNSRLRALAARILRKHPLHSAKQKPSQESIYGIKVVCISDTHNQRPELPDGDILIHAGDLTENGPFDEVQSGLNWLSSLPYQHKFLVAGNHDVLLDGKFLALYPERRYGEVRTRNDLDWGNVRYLENSSVTVEFQLDPTKEANVQVKIFGSPYSREYGVSAFTYRREDNIWAGRIPDDADIVVTHCPPHLHLDQQGFHRAGCPYLAEELFRCKPRLAVFGHIHVAYGREDVVLDRALRAHDDIQRRWGGWFRLAELILLTYFARLRKRICRATPAENVTTLVNAAVVGGSANALRNEPIVVSL